MILTGIPVVRKGQTGLICPECKAPMSESVWKKVTHADMGMKCSNCPNKFTPNSAIIGATAASKRFLKERGVRTKTWFHATVNENWFEAINAEANPLLVHVGLESTAHARGVDILDYAGGTYYLWEVRLSKSAQVNPNILDDNNRWPLFVGEELDAKYAGYSDDYAVTRYLNRWETPGALSLLVQAGVLEVVRMTVHTL